MPILVLLLILLLLAGPWVIVAAGVGLLIFLPAYLLLTSTATLLLVPQQILQVATDRRVRRVHACEHATANVLEEKMGPLPMVGGVATKRGFYLWGAERFHPSVVFGAAQEGLARMKRGEHMLAVHPRCGTSLGMARLVFAVVFLGLLFAGGYFSFGTVLLAMAASWLLGKPLGLLVQRYLTTAPDVYDLQITHVSWVDRPEVGAPALFAAPRGAYFFHTTPHW